MAPLCLPTACHEENYIIPVLDEENEINKELGESIPGVISTVSDTTEFTWPKLTQRRYRSSPFLNTNIIFFMPYAAWCSSYALAEDESIPFQPPCFTIGSGNQSTKETLFHHHWQPVQSQEQERFVILLCLGPFPHPNPWCKIHCSDSLLVLFFLFSLNNV